MAVWALKMLSLFGFVGDFPVSIVGVLTLSVVSKALQPLVYSSNGCVLVCIVGLGLSCDFFAGVAWHPSGGCWSLFGSLYLGFGASGFVRGL